MALAALVSGCASVIADLPVIGVPEGTPERPATQAPYPAVHDMPPRREDMPLDAREQQKLEQELTQARDSQGKRAEEIAQPPPAPRRPAPQKAKAGATRTDAAGSGRNP